MREKGEEGRGIRGISGMREEGRVKSETVYV